MTVNYICHTLWELGDQTHLCGRVENHDSWHLCACGEVLLTGRGLLSDEARHHRSVDCPECNARAGRPCVHRREHGSDVVMPGVHASRAKAAGSNHNQRNQP